jgi:lantibiotic modifying enzyme
MIKSTKITDEELKEIKDLQQNSQILTYQIGEISLQREFAQKQFKKLDDEFNNFISSFEKLQEKEIELVEKLKTQYPDRSINLETGELS